MSFYTVDNQHKADFFASLTVDDVTADLATGADPNERDEKNVAPLHWIASGNEEPAVVAALLAAGADLHTRDADGWTPLHWVAMWNKSADMVSTLPASGADPHARNREKYTPLHLAAEHNDAPAVVFVHGRSRHRHDGCRSPGPGPRRDGHAAPRGQ